MDCRGCGTKTAYLVETKTDFEWCNECGKPTMPRAYDVFFDGKPCEQIKDENGKPMQFLSKGHKAAVLERRGLMEVGDKVHGAAYGEGPPTPPVDRKKERAAVREAVEIAKRKIKRR